MNKVALVTGAAGISGRAIIEQLCSSDWKKIFAVSRTKKEDETIQDERLVHVYIDLDKKEDLLVPLLREIGAQEVTHVFWTAYVHSKNEQELIERNSPLFIKFLKAFLRLEPQLERFYLQTGGKYYGIHKGPVACPQTEKTPRHDGENFYFHQEDTLKDLQKGQNWSWNIMRPSVIVGVSKGNGMSMAPSLALYFLVQKELNKTAVFPGNPVNYYGIQDVSFAPLGAQFAVWMSTSKNTENQEFNFVNGDKKTWRQIWSGIAEYFPGVIVEEPKFDGHVKGPTTKVQHEYLLADYMKDKKEVWEKIVDKYGGDKKLWEYATFDFADATFGQSWPNEVDMTKAKEFGWDKQEDSVQAFHKTFDRMKELGMIPKVWEAKQPTE
jgi:nucleoside-diphosphate-sugar epimerase